MLSCLSDSLRKLSRSITADLVNSPQFSFPNPGNSYPSEDFENISDILFSPVSLKDDPSESKKRDHKKKNDVHQIGPGPQLNDVLDQEVGSPTPEAPKTDACGEVKDETKARGDQDQSSLDKDLWNADYPRWFE